MFVNKCLKIKITGEINICAKIEILQRVYLDVSCHILNKHKSIIHVKLLFFFTVHLFVFELIILVYQPVAYLSSFG